MEAMLKSHETVYTDHLTLILGSGSGTTDVHWNFEVFPSQNKYAWNESDMHRAVSCLRSIIGPPLKETIHEEQLHIISPETGSFLCVTGLCNIQRYCSTENPSLGGRPEWIRQTILASDTFPDKYLHFLRSCVYEEHRLTSDNETTVRNEMIGKTLKNYVLKKRICFEDTQSHICYEIHIIKQVPDEKATMVQSSVHVYPSHYKFIVSFPSLLSSPSYKQDIPLTLKKLVEHGVRLLKMLSNEPVLTNKDQRLAVLAGYHELLQTKMQNASSNEFFFFNPKPVTLERINLIDPDENEKNGIPTYGIVSVLKGYTVTDKADGERMLLYIHTDRYAYLINNILEVKNTGLKVNNARYVQTLLDGEFIYAHQQKNDTDRDVFAIFDIYFFHAEKVMDLPLMDAFKPGYSHTGRPSRPRGFKLDTRLEYMKQFADAGIWDFSQSNCDVIVKEFYDGDDAAKIFHACNVILNKPNQRYDIDGLIFTPKALPVLSYYPKRTVRITQSLRWNRVFKWKPPHMNTIDFLVKELDASVIHKDGKTYKSFTLLAGHNVDRNLNISIEKALRLMYDDSPEAQQELDDFGSDYRPHPFSSVLNAHEDMHIAYVEVDANGFMRASNGDIIKDDSIVEYAYDTAGEHEAMGYRWQPLRVREDKTRIYRSTEDKSKSTANDMSTARNIWRSIHEPVSESMITGNEIVPNAMPNNKVDRILGMDNTYYARDIPRFHLLSFNMLEFHNKVVKKNLYDRPPENKRGRLLELACGQVGDLSQWMSSNYKLVVGIDLVKHNVVNADSGCYARVLKRLQKAKKEGKKLDFPTMAFIVGDCGKDLTHLDSGAIDDDESKEVAQWIFRGKGPSYIKDKFKCANSTSFDVVSCQFAIHYFWQNKEMLRTFLKNVSHFLTSGGHFLCTFMDGETVHESFRDIKRNFNGAIVNKGVSHKTVSWAIEKKYETYKDDDVFGKAIDVYLQNTNQTIQEYLVNFKELQKIALEYGLSHEDADSEMFSRTLDQYRDSTERNVRRQVDSILMDNAQTRFLGFNRWAVFKKM